MIKKEVGLKLFLGIFLLVILSSGVLAVDEGKCEVVARSECTNDDTNGYIVMGLSSETNAHGEIGSSGAYPYVLCCNFGEGDTTCKPDNENKIIGLSALTNAHAEGKTETSYSNHVCYQSISCRVDTSCDENENEILSLTSTTNAHIGGAGDYPNNKVCCTKESMAWTKDCVIKSARWNVSSVTEGNNAFMNVKGSGPECAGKLIDFNVLEKDVGSYSGKGVTQPNSISLNDRGEVMGVWKAQYIDDGIFGNPEFVFNVSLTSNSDIFLLNDSSELEVSEGDPSLCLSISSCGDYINKETCNSDSCNANLQVSVPEEYTCGVTEGLNCFCKWNDPENKCEGGWSRPNSPIVEGCSYGYTLCENEGGLYCSWGNSCPKGEIPDCDEDGECESGEGCLSEDCVNGDKDNCADNFYCIDGECSNVINPIFLGIDGFDEYCVVSQTVAKGCDVEPVGYKNITWTGSWTGETQSGAEYEKCIAGGTMIIPCAAQIELPFFDYLELMITLIVLIAVYSLLIYNKKKKGKKKSH
jgi:hypothetical protein